MTVAHVPLSTGRTSLLLALRDLLDEEGVPYCVLHGVEQFPERVPSDVDCLVPAEWLPHRLAALLVANETRLGARLIQWIQHEATAHFFVLAGQSDDGERVFLEFDVSSDFRRDQRVFYSGEELLRDRRQVNGFWAASAAHEFGHYLVKKIGKGVLAEDHARRLAALYATDPAGCERELRRCWAKTSAEQVRLAAETGDWSSVRANIGALRSEMRQRVGSRRPLQTARGLLADGLRRTRRVLEPTGAHLVILGPDGSGKSTIIEATRPLLAFAFRRVANGHFAPALFRGGHDSGPVIDPHARPPRSLPASIAKAGYWLGDFTAGYYASIRPKLVKSTLVIYDRYYLDVLVDPARYRFQGPAWLSEAVWRCVPKPDIIVLLDAPAEVLQARKQEVSFVETARQRLAYRELVERLPNGRVVDADRPPAEIADDVAAIVLEFLAERVRARLDVEGTPSTPAH
jgi:thymidylate kinase